MENPRLQDWRSWSAVRKAQAAGFLIGALGTIIIGGIFFDSVAYPMARSPHDFPFSPAVICWLVITLLSNKLGALVGVAPSWEDHDPFTLAIRLGIAALVNGLLMALAGALLGLIFRNRVKP